MAFPDHYKQFVNLTLLVGQRGQVLTSQTMYKFKIKLLRNAETFFCTKTELLNFKVTLPLSKSGIIISRLVSNGLIFSGDIPVDVQLVTFLFLSNIMELNIGRKARKIW